MALIDNINKSQFMKFKIVLGGETIKIDLNKELKIDPDGLNEEAMIQPQIYAYLGTIHSRLVREAKAADENRKAVRARRTEEIKTSESISASAAEKTVYSDNAYMEAAKALRNWEYKRDCLEKMLDSFKQRASMMQTISANVRQIN